VKSFLYTLVLLAVLLACVILLRSIDSDDHSRLRTPDRAAAPSPLVESAAPRATSTDFDRYRDATADELYDAGVELLHLWHVREATELLERSVAADSSYYRAYVKLIECYSHPIVGREDAAGTALRLAEENRFADADTNFLAGLSSLYIDRDYATAAALLRRASNSEASHEDAAYYTALAMFKSGRLDEALKTIEELLQADETFGRLTELSIRCAVARGDLDGAREQSRELARMYAGEPFPYVLLAMVELMNGNTESAVEFCNNALVLDSKYIPAIVARANLYAAERDFEAARVSFEKLLLFDDPVLRALGMDGVGFVDMLWGRFDDATVAMDEAIRSAIVAGEVRQGLTFAEDLIGYLCQLGQGDVAEGVVDRWITGFGDIPVDLGMLRIRILEGDRERARRTLIEMKSKKEWVTWAGMMSIDFAEVNALAHIGEENYQTALETLSKGPGTGPSVPGARAFLRGYAAFQNGDAEEAAEAFMEVGRRLFGVEFPYRGNPVFFVRSLFYLGEVGIARGDREAAVAYYERFLEYWDGADWDIQAVTRAREKIAGLTGTP
jgi:tetratricopeptide (TPR) repeat protein